MQTQPIYSIQRDKGFVLQVSGNVLPCQIHHHGKVNASRRYWNPRKASDGSLTAHFRGRRLQGKVMKAPEGYRAVVLKSTAKTVKDSSLKLEAMAEFEASSKDADPATRQENEEQLQAAARQGDFHVADCHVMEEVAELEDIVVWGHDQVPEATSDAYSRGIGEWIALAQTVSVDRNGV